MQHHTHENPAMLADASPSQRINDIIGREHEEKKAPEIFCEMEELRAVGDHKELVWRETARWVRFEENVAEEGNRWTKPHVASLSLHSLFELRRGLMTGCVMLDLPANNLQMIADMLLQELMGNNQIEPESCDKIRHLLMKQHRHQSFKKSVIRSLSEIGKSSKSESDLLNASYAGNGSVDNLQSSQKIQDSTSDLLSPSDVNGASSARRHSNVSTASFSSATGLKFNEHFIKKIQPGSQVANILVGETDLVKQPVMAFIRLSEAALLGNITEVALPTRFLFLLLGPIGDQKRCYEIGRAVGALMCDEIFREVAYYAHDINDILTGIDEFLDQVTVLPPGEWDPSIKIMPPKSVPSQEGRRGSANIEGKQASIDLEKKEEEEEDEEEDHGDVSLQRTGRLFGGLVADIKRKAPFYISDYTDAFTVQVLASMIFMYFASLAPIVTFGGLLGAATDNYMGAMESLVSGAICGISYHLLSGQPLTILGSTGPILVFETIVFNFCKDQELNYLTFRFYIGAWVFVTLMVMVAFDLSALVRYITRFTEEAFAALIALIFIVEAFQKLFHILDERPVNTNLGQELDYNCSCKINNTVNGTLDEIEVEMYGDSHYVTLGERCKEIHNGLYEGSGCDTTIYYPDVFFFCVLIFVFTFGIAYTLKMFRNGPFLPAKVRSFISDFAVIIAIGAMVGADVGLGFNTPKLLVPESFKPTRDDRGWVVDVGANPIWTIFAAIGFALLATILLFMDQQITSVIINRKEHKLRKGKGYHLDLTLIAFQIVTCSLLGTPWFVAATVLSINHVRSLTVESECTAPGETPKFLGVREQRVTGMVAFILVGVSVLMGSILKYVSMAILYGVFLFMGVASLNGLQMINRLLIIFIPPKYQPDYPYLEHVPLARVHLFTVIQVICLALLWVIKTIKSISMVFPIMVLALCFIRKALELIFTQHELSWLDDILPLTESQKRKLKEKKDLLNQELLGTYSTIEINNEKNSSPLEINISDEMTKTTIWRQLTVNDLTSDTTNKAGDTSTVIQRKPTTEDEGTRL